MCEDFPGEFPPVKESKSDPKPVRANAGHFVACPHCAAYLFSATRLPVLYKTAGEIKPSAPRKVFKRSHPTQGPARPAPKEDSKEDATEQAPPSKKRKRAKPSMK